MESLSEEDQEHLTRSLIQCRSGDWDMALSELQAISRPDHALVQANLAFVEEKRGQTQKARDHYLQAIAIAPYSAELRFNWANFLAHHDTPPTARDQYLATLTLEPNHLGAWINLGANLVESGRLSAARTAFQAALALQPLHGGALLNLGQVALHQQENQEAADIFRQLLTLDPQQREAHRGLATALSRCGDENAATPHRDRAYQDQPMLEFPSIRTGVRQLLILASAHDGNVPWHNLIDRTNTTTRVIALDYFPEHQPFPAHDLLFNAIGDADRCRQALFQAQRRWPYQGCRRNDPHRIASTSRRQLPSTLAQIPHLRLARCESWGRDQSHSIAESVLLNQWMILQGWDFPLLLRAPGFHGGQFFERIEHPDDLPGALQRLPGSTLLVSELLPTQSPDGSYRKYRVMSLGGRLYPLHLAISSHWKVHYFSADMTARPDYRDEEEDFLDGFEQHLPPHALKALNDVQQRLNLDYAGMDFTLDDKGNVLLFEANATMVIAPPPEDPLWSYRQPAYWEARQQAQSLFLADPPH